MQHYGNAFRKSVGKKLTMRKNEENETRICNITMKYSYGYSFGIYVSCQIPAESMNMLNQLNFYSQMVFGMCKLVY